MTCKFTNAVLATVAGLGLTLGLALAQQPDAAGAQSQKSGSANRTESMVGHDMTVTGCLAKDPKEKKEYLITGDDGKTWGLTSKSVKLASHLNHKVTVTGKVTKAEHESEAGDLDVSDLKMVSTSCSK